MKHPIIFTAELECTLSQFIDECKPDKVFILTDDVTIEACYPIVQHFYCLKNSVCITIPSSDNNKTFRVIDTGLELFAKGKSNTPLTADKSWWRNDNRFRRLCGCNFQTWNAFYQSSHDCFSDG